MEIPDTMPHPSRALAAISGSLDSSIGTVVCIPCFRRPQHLRLTLESLAGQRTEAVATCPLFGDERTSLQLVLRSEFDTTRTLQSLVWSNFLFQPRPHEVSFVGLSNIRVSGVSVLEVRIVFGRSSTLVSNQARCIQAAA